MPVRPNFTALESDGNEVFVRGQSSPNDPQDFADIVDIRVAVVQGGRIHSSAVQQLASDWVAVVPVKDPNGAQADFQLGDATAFGWETRGLNAGTFTWIETLPITAV
jgi:hypothetical protein